MTAIGTRMVEALGPIHVINLPERGDRRREFARQLGRIGFGYDHPDVTLFAAVRPTDAGGFPSIGARGCFLSHLEILRAARGAEAPQIAICEDDLDFSEDFEDRAPTLFEELAGMEWDVFYGGFDAAAHGVTAPPGLVRLDPGQKVLCTHFLALRRPAIDALVPYLEAMTRRRMGDPAGGPMHVDGAYSHFRADHPEMVTVAVSPTLGRQRPSRTDVHDLRWFDRMPLFREAVGALRRLR
jgi:hypothetical protein